ncbi:MAG: hypothetical protein JO345_27660 [Streptosporangiaceae bacterium]|nr:hypothetical protein [Streptosporangiaceae bacterium]
MSISEEIRASAGAHRDLGPKYDTAVAEGLVERIGEEIDRRVETQLNAYAREMMPPPRQWRAQRAQAQGRLGFGHVMLALGSMGLAVGATGVVLHPSYQANSAPSGALVALIWIVIGIINVAYARRH